MRSKKDRGITSELFCLIADFWGRLSLRITQCGFARPVPALLELLAYLHRLCRIEQRARRTLEQSGAEPLPRV
jgi:hypothetical protein